jgi:hypothetical protein
VGKGGEEEEEEAREFSSFIFSFALRLANVEFWPSDLQEEEEEEKEKRRGGQKEERERR